MTAGGQDTLIELQRATPETDEYNEEVQGWDDPEILGTEWAQVFWGRGDERRQAAMEQGQQAATFRVYSNETTRSVSLRDRIMLDGEAWDILGVSPVGRSHIELTGVRAQ